MTVRRCCCCREQRIGGWWSRSFWVLMQMLTLPPLLLLQRQNTLCLGILRRFLLRGVLFVCWDVLVWSHQPKKWHSGFPAAGQAPDHGTETRCTPSHTPVHPCKPQVTACTVVPVCSCAAQCSGLPASGRVRASVDRKPAPAPFYRQHGRAPLRRADCGVQGGLCPL